MNFVGEQEVVSLFIWTQCKLDGRRRQAKEIRVTSPVVVEERDLDVDVKEDEGWEKGKQIEITMKELDGIQMWWQGRNI